MLGQMTAVLADGHINVVDMLNKSRGDVAYNLIDVGDEPDASLIDEICAIESVMNVREFKM
jgi:D-3-phosphoglycerate dehydrogenase